MSSRDVLPGFDLIEEMERGELEEYVRSLLWQLRLCDAFWFLKVEDEHSKESAELLNQRVWAKVGELGAKDILARFGPFEKGVRGVWEAYRYFPWTVMVDYRTEDMPDGSLEITVDKCPAQEGRRRHGIGEYMCRHMHGEEFQNFARVIDPRVKVECLFAPPDPQPDPRPHDCDCRWRFSINEK